MFQHRDGRKETDGASVFSKEARRYVAHAAQDTRADTVRRSRRANAEEAGGAAAANGAQGRRFPTASKPAFTPAHTARVREHHGRTDSSGFELIEERPRKPQEQHALPRGPRDREKAAHAAREREHDARTTETGGMPAWMGDAGAGTARRPGVDSIQEFKAQMREKERRERGEPVDQAPAPSADAERAPAPIEDPSGMGRSSRFARFFDAPHKDESHSGSNTPKQAPAATMDSLDLFSMFKNASLRDAGPGSGAQATPPPQQVPAPQPAPQPAQPAAQASGPSSADVASMQKIMSLLQGGAKRPATQPAHASPAPAPAPAPAPRGADQGAPRPPPPDSAAFLNSLLSRSRSGAGTPGSPAGAPAPPPGWASPGSPAHGSPAHPPPGMFPGGPHPPWPMAPMPAPSARPTPPPPGLVSPGGHPTGPPPGLARAPPHAGGVPVPPGARPPPGL